MTVRDVHDYQAWNCEMQAGIVKNFQDFQMARLRPIDYYNCGLDHRDSRPPTAGNTMTVRSAAVRMPECSLTKKGLPMTPYDEGETSVDGLRNTFAIPPLRIKAVRLGPDGPLQII